MADIPTKNDVRELLVELLGYAPTWAVDKWALADQVNDACQLLDRLVELPVKGTEAFDKVVARYIWRSEGWVTDEEIVFDVICALREEE